MVKFLTVDEMVESVGLEEMLQLAGIGNKRDDNGRQLDRAKIEAALKFADDTVISKLSARYETIDTLTPEKTPDLLKGAVEDIARYRLRRRSGNQNQVTEEVRNSYKDALAFLDEIRCGKSALDIEGDPRGDETRAFGILASLPEDRTNEILAGYK